MNSDLLSGQGVLAKYALTETELVNMVLDAGLVAYKKQKDRQIINGILQEEYIKRRFTRQWDDDGYPAIDFALLFGGILNFFFRQGDIEAIVYSNEKRWEALLDTKLTDRQRKAVQAVFMKMEGASNVDVLEKLYPGQSKNKSSASQLRQIAEKLAAKQNPPLTVPPWES